MSDAKELADAAFKRFQERNATELADAKVKKLEALDAQLKEAEEAASGQIKAQQEQIRAQEQELRKLETDKSRARADARQYRREVAQEEAQRRAAQEKVAKAAEAAKEKEKAMKATFTKNSEAVVEAMPEQFGNPLKGLEQHGAVEPVAKAKKELGEAGKALAEHVNKDPELTKLHTEVAEAHRELRKLQVKGEDGKWSPKEGVANDTVKAADERLKKATSKFEKALDPKAEGAAEAVTKHAEARKAAEKFTKGGWAKAGFGGKAAALGYGGAIKDNFAGEGISFKSKAGRGVGAVVGAGAVIDAVRRGTVMDPQTGEEMPRSMASRFIELAAGVGIAGASLAGGRVR